MNEAIKNDIFKSLSQIDDLFNTVPEENNKSNSVDFEIVDTKIEEAKVEVNNEEVYNKLRELTADWLEVQNKYKTMENKLLELKQKRKEIEEEIKKYINPNEPKVIDGRKITWSVYVEKRFDSKRFKENYPQLYEQFVKENTRERFNIK